MCMYNLGSSYYATSLDLMVITNTMYEKIRTLTKSINYKVLILLSKISFHNGSSIQCSDNNLNSNHIKTNIFRIIKANYTPPYLLGIDGGLTKIFLEIMEINHRIRIK